jgi:hypothetical protein
MASSVPAPKDIRDQVHRFSVELGEPAPSSAVYVRTTRELANDLLGAAVDTDQQVYLVALCGNFKLLNARVPPGQPPPVGSVASLVIDASTGAVVDFGVSQHKAALPLSSLGEVHEVFG